jgi:hypothetical protein
LSALRISVTTEAPEEAPDRKEFHIDSERAADWLIGKYAAIDAEIALLRSQADAAVRRLQSDREGLEHLYQSEFEAFARAAIAADKRGRKSIILPHGTCALRTVPASVRVTDATSALIWCRENRPDLVKVREEADTREYLRIAQEEMQQSGEVLPGVEVVPERESFTVRFGSKE